MDRIRSISWDQILGQQNLQTLLHWIFFFFWGYFKDNVRYVLDSHSSIKTAILYSDYRNSTADMVGTGLKATKEARLKVNFVTIVI